MIFAVGQKGEPMSDLISTQESVVKIVDTAIRKILSGEQKLTKEYEQSVIDAVDVILNTSRRTYGDLIERQDAMNMTKRLLGDSEISATMQTALHILPSAQPEIIRCKECKHWREGTVHSYCSKLFGMGVLGAYNYMTDENDYCSMAERRVDE